MPVRTSLRAVFFLAVLALGCGGAESPPAVSPVDEAPAEPAPPIPTPEEETATPTSGAMCGTIRGLGCPDGQYCDYAAGDGCIPDGAGVCKPRPEACTMDYVPVCGCDGRTYGNACGAAAAGMSVARPGECTAQP